jgi:hypothetical protein
MPDAALDITLNPSLNTILGSGLLRIFVTAICNLPEALLH